MKDSKQSFKDLVKKMDSLEETQQGKLKGGFSRSLNDCFESFIKVNLLINTRIIVLSD